jgi:2-polyprenyl-3-methyl-5-hydroxy-6-metoxy-1,4-benzoquinol methylase
MIKLFKLQIKKVLNRYIKHICKDEFELQHFKKFNERPVEISFLFKHFSRIYPKKVLDVGTGVSALPHIMHICGSIVTSIDNYKDYWSPGTINRHFHVINEDIKNPIIKERFDFITCVSVLEHIENANKAVSNMFKLLLPDGHMVLSFPYTEKRYYSNVYKRSGSQYGQDARYICQSFSKKEIDIWLEKGNGQIIDQEYWKFWDGECWTVGNHIIPPQKTTAKKKHQLCCLLLKKTN